MRATRLWTWTTRSSPDGRYLEWTRGRTTWPGWWHLEPRPRAAGFDVRTQPRSRTARSPAGRSSGTTHGAQDAPVIVRLTRLASAGPRDEEPWRQPPLATAGRSRAVALAIVCSRNSSAAGNSRRSVDQVRPIPRTARLSSISR